MSKDNFFNMVVGVCSNHFKISKEVIRGHSRKREIVNVRFIAILIMTLLEEYTLQNIGLFFNGRDHSTISNARKEINYRLGTSQYSSLKLRFEYCEKKARFILGQSKEDPDQMYLFNIELNQIKP